MPEKPSASASGFPALVGTSSLKVDSLRRSEEEFEHDISISMVSPTILTCDTVVNSVVEKFIERSNLGKQKYGTTLDRTDLSTDEWANHMQEELMDAILYLERLRRELYENSYVRRTGEFCRKNNK